MPLARRERLRRRLCLSYKPFHVQDISAVTAFADLSRGAVPMRAIRRADVNIAAAALVAVLVPFVAFARLILFHFYVRGGFVLDTGLIAALLWHSDAALTQPPSVGGGSFFATHVTPLFLPIAALSRALPLSLPQFFAVFVGASHALLALAVFWLLVAGFDLRRGLRPWLAALAAIGFAASGLAIAIARYPHFETLIAAFFLLFAVASALGHWRTALTFFVLGLASREDAGLHYAAFLAVLLAASAAHGVSLRRQRTGVGFALLGVAYACTAMTAQRWIFPGGSAFTRVYLGEPPLAHLSAAVIGARLLYLLADRSYIILPAIGALVWALLTRNVFIVLGFAACLPWLSLNLLAKSAFASAMASYYAFPFLVALAWPLLATLPRSDRPLPQGRAVDPVIGFTTLLALTFVPNADVHDPGRLALPEAFLAAPSFAQQAAVDHAVAAISAARPSLGRLIVDNSVAAIAPGGFTDEQVRLTRGDQAAALAGPPDTVAYFTQGYDADWLRQEAVGAGLGWTYRMPGTPVHLASRFRLDGIPALVGRLVAE